MSVLKHSCNHTPTVTYPALRYGHDINKTYANAGTAVVHMFHGGLWGGWQYQVASQDAANGALMFSHGGYQEARGSGINSQHYFVENVMEGKGVVCGWYQW
jgi:hypothetical protein